MSSQSVQDDAAASAASIQEPVASLEFTRRRFSWAPGPNGALTFRRGEVLWRDALRRRLLAFADAGAVLGAMVMLLLGSGATDQVLWASLLVPIWILLAKFHGLYDRDHRALRHLTVDELASILLWSMGGTAATAFVLAVAPVDPLSAGGAVLLGVSVAFADFVLRGLSRVIWRRVTPAERTLIVGDGPLAQAARRKLELFPDIHAELVDARNRLVAGDIRQARADFEGLDRVILASDTIDELLIAELVRVCRDAHVKLSVVPPARGMFGTAVQLNHVADLPVVEYNTWDVSRSTMLLKRALDIGLSGVLLLLLAPLLVLIAAAIRIDSRGASLFSQRRAGVGGRTFRMLKFRTMVADAESRLGEVVCLEELPEPIFKLERDPRVTRVGRALRRTSLDELPQLVNVLRGEMSLVGPRPEQVELVAKYLPEHQFRLSLKPGLTGPMQVYGRGQLTFEERLAVEREYIENLSIGRDLRILAMTIPAVVAGRGAF